MTAVTPVLFFFPGFHLCLPMGVRSLQTPLESQFEKRKPVFVFFTVRIGGIADILKRQTKSSFVKTCFEYLQDF
jgi:hypothetical protein